jgi:hypothetical protein
VDAVEVQLDDQPAARPHAVDAILAPDAVRPGQRQPIGLDHDEEPGLQAAEGDPRVPEEDAPQRPRPAAVRRPVEDRGDRAGTDVADPRLVTSRSLRR